MKTLHNDRLQSDGEEIANAISHGLGLLLAIAALPFLVLRASWYGTATDVVAAGMFASSMILLYGVSMLYHGLRASRAKAWLNRLDHAAIYIFIAGSYTPFALGVLRGGWGWSLFVLVWSIATVGVVGKLLNRLRSPLVSTVLYLAMGWIVVLAAGPLLTRMPGPGLAWLVAGGLSYTLGAIVYMFDHRYRYTHFVWHLFVLAGSACHAAAALWYAYG